MENNWSSMRYSPANDDDISGSMSNTHSDIFGVQGTINHDDNGMHLDPVPYTQPESGHAGQVQYSTNHVRTKSTSCSPCRIPSAPIHLIPGRHHIDSR